MPIPVLKNTAIALTLVFRAAPPAQESDPVDEADPVDVATILARMQQASGGPA